MHEHHFWHHFHHDRRHAAGGRGGPFSPGARGGRRGGYFGFGGGGPGGFDVTRGRKLTSAELHLVLLALLAEKPRHGYDLIRAIDERSGGFYVPSPGVIYPALTYLEEAGDITSAPEGARKLYTLTEDGQNHLSNERGVVDEIFERLAAIGERMGRIREAFTDEDPEAGPGFPAGRGPWQVYGELGQAIRDFHMAMRNAKRLSPETVSQLVTIIRRAAGAIRTAIEADE